VWVPRRNGEYIKPLLTGHLDGDTTLLIIEREETPACRTLCEEGLVGEARADAPVDRAVDLISRTAVYVIRLCGGVGEEES
jgi:hypothetical protein